MTPDEVKRRKMEMHDLRDEADLAAHQAVADILHRQWLYIPPDNGYGDRRMAVRHLGDVIRKARAEALEAAKAVVLNYSPEYHTDSICADIEKLK